MNLLKKAGLSAEPLVGGSFEGSPGQGDIVRRGHHITQSGEEGQNLFLSTNKID